MVSPEERTDRYSLVTGGLGVGSYHTQDGGDPGVVAYNTQGSDFGVVTYNT